MAAPADQYSLPSNPTQCWVTRINPDLSKAKANALNIKPVLSILDCLSPSLKNTLNFWPARSFSFKLFKLSDKINKLQEQQTTRTHMKNPMKSTIKLTART